MTSPNNIYPKNAYTDEQRETLAAQIAVATKGIGPMMPCPDDVEHTSLRCDPSHGHCVLRFQAVGKGWPEGYQYTETYCVCYSEMLADPDKLRRRVRKFLAEERGNFLHMHEAVTGPSRDFVCALLDEIDELNETIEGLSA
jgi:hypothetical protein